MRTFWFSPNAVANGILWLVGAALQIGGWVSQTLAYTLLSIALFWSVCTFVYWWKNKRGKQLETTVREAITPDLNQALEKLKAIGRLEDISRQDANLIIAMSIELEGRHGYNDFTGLLADRASGVALNELKTRPCSQCGIPRNQRGKHGK